MNGLMKRDDRNRMNDGFVSLEKAMDRLFGNGFVRPSQFEFFGTDLALDMFEKDHEIVVKMAIPGIRPDDIQVTVVGNELTIRGEAKAEENSEGQNYIRRERCYGKFTRSVMLPDYVQADKASAELEHGVLTLKIPKQEEVKAKTIAIKAKAS